MASKLLRTLRLVHHVKLGSAGTSCTHITEILGYRFTHPGWLHLALLPPEVNRRTNYERLAFLGDSLFSFITAEHWFSSQQPALRNLTEEPEKGKILSILAVEGGLVAAQQALGYFQEEALAELVACKQA